MSGLFDAGGIICTGASRGIGAAIAKQLAVGLGQKVIIDGRSADALQAVADDINAAASTAGSGGVCVACVGDVTDEAHSQELVQRCKQEFGSVLSIVCNAGTAEPMGETDKISADNFRDVIEVNLIAPFCLWKAARHDLLENGGCVINVSSGASVSAVNGGSGYSCSKAALNMLSAVQRNEGVRSISIRPGTVDTTLLKAAFKPENFTKMNDGEANPVVAGIRQRYAEGSVLSPDQPARSIAALAASRAWPEATARVTAPVTMSASAAGGEGVVVKNWNDDEILELAGVLFGNKARL